MEFTLAATDAAPYGDVLGRVREALGEAGFGVLTEIDITTTLRTKLGVETPPRVILGACRPQLAHQALQADPRVATLLPCNVVVTGAGDAVTEVEVFDPAIMPTLSDHPALRDVVDDARRRLTAMLAALAAPDEETDDAASR
ncbi:MAG TPA: DUF302 domain-containing protein [Phytomonospora sp.]